MKHSGLWSILLAALLGSCSRRQPLYIEDGSRSYEVIVVADHNDSLHHLLSEPMIGLPQNEPLFDVVSMTKAEVEAGKAAGRPVIYFSDTTRFWAASPADNHGQLMVWTDGSKVRELQRYLLDAEQIRMRWQLMRQPHTKAEAEIAKMFHVDMRVPAELTAMKRGRDFLWLSNNAADGMKNIVLFRDHSQLSFPQNVDSVLQVNIPGEETGMYMRLATWQAGDEIEMRHPDPSLLCTMNSVLQWRGLWEMKGDAMGGPYIMKAFLSKDFWILGFVYAPGSKKRNLIRELEAAIGTVQLR